MAAQYEAARGWPLLPEGAVRHTTPSRLAAGPLVLPTAAVAATLLLMLGAGFRFATGGHLAQTLDRAPQPLVAQDRFYQQLHWLGALISPSGDAAGGVHSDALLLAGCGLAALVCCYALLRLVIRLAAPDAIALVAGVLVVGLSWLGSGYALVSGGVLPGGYFSATQVATVIVALSLALALDGSLGLGIALLGLACDADTAVALWGAAGLAGASLAAMRDEGPVGHAWLRGGACALVLAAPSLTWWAREIAAGSASLGADTPYREAAAPFSIWLVPLQGWVLFFSDVALGLAACSVLGSGARAARGALLGVLAVFAAGCVLPFLTGNPWLLALRPIGADVFLQLLAVAVATAVILRDLPGGGGLLRVALSVVIAACLLLHWLLLPVAALAMLTRAAAAQGELLGLERRIPDWNPASLHRLAMTAVIIAAVAGGLARGGLPLH